MEVHVDRAWVGRTIEQMEEATGARIPFVFRMGSGNGAQAQHASFRTAIWSYAAVVDAQARGGRGNTRFSAERSMTMRVAIAGAGNVGRSIAAELDRERSRGAADRQGSARDQVRDADGGGVAAGGRLRTVLARGSGPRHL